ncbi:unnamed protein product [Closterium sp. NIES-54]
MPVERTLEMKGARTVHVRSAGYEKERVIIMLAVTASGLKLPPYVVFKRKTIPKVMVPFLKPLHESTGRRREALVVLDSYCGHLTEGVGQTMRMFRLSRAVIPRGCTPLVQPLDVSINRAFKCGVRHRYSGWFEEEGINTTTKAGELNHDIRMRDYESIEDHLILAHMRDNCEVEVLDDVNDRVDDELVINPFYAEVPMPAEELHAAAEEADAAEEDVEAAAAEEAGGVLEEGGEAEEPSDDECIADMPVIPGVAGVASRGRRMGHYTAMSGRGIGPPVGSMRFMRQLMLAAAVTATLLSVTQSTAEPASLLTDPASTHAPSPLYSTSQPNSTAHNCTCPPVTVPPLPQPIPCSPDTVTTVSSVPTRQHTSHRRKVKRNNHKATLGNGTISGSNIIPTSPHSNCSSNSSSNSSECNPGVPHVAETSAKGDPHLIGRHGEKFEFHGQDGASYCLVSDRKVQINMHLFAGAKNGSTYIDEIGVVTSSGIHIVVSAQSAADVSTAGVQGQLEVNSASLPDDILTIDLLRHTVRIERCKASVRVRVRGVVDLTVDILPDLSRKSRPNYLNIRIASLHASHKVHGIIGQTYQDSATRLSRFSESQGKNGPAKERAIIDGTERDYRTSGILDADCKFQQFRKERSGHHDSE